VSNGHKIGRCANLIERDAGYPAGEYQETLNKAKALAVAIEMAEK